MKAGRKSIYINANAIKTGVIITFINEKAEPVIDLRLKVPLIKFQETRRKMYHYIL